MGLGENDLKTNQYGFLDWEAYSKKFGFFSCSPINDSDRCAAYITKYISKGFSESDFSAGAHLFFASQGLKGATCIRKQIVERCPIENWDFENEWCKIKWVDSLDVLSDL